MMGYWMRCRNRKLGSWALAAAGLLFSSGAGASPELDTATVPPDVAQAELSAARAYDAFQRGDYASAVALYQQAFDAAPSADALFNIARVYDLGLRDRPLAITFYRRYVSDAGATPERIKRANERLTELREAETAELATRPAAPRAVQPAPAGAFVAAPASGPLEQDAGGEWSGLKIAALASGAAGAVLLSVGAGFGISLLSTAERANRECHGNECSSQRGVDAARAAARDARWANWGLGVGGGLLAGATLMWLLDPGAEQAAPPASMKLSPIAGGGELGVALAGSW
jgi:tetratricopeptide (TPR) repeat protein